jgi:CRISPR/Cas system-associated protein endoribonuclease Cas2
MIDLKEIVIIILLLLNLICFGLGYILSKISNYELIVSDKTIDQNQNKNTKNKQIEKIEIDVSKVVTKINTDSLEKKYDTLGETKTSQEKIENSVNKLKNMKG